MVHILLHPNLEVDPLEAVVRTFQFKAILLLGSLSVFRRCYSMRSFVECSHASGVLLRCLSAKICFAFLVSWWCRLSLLVFCCLGLLSVGRRLLLLFARYSVSETMLRFRLFLSVVVLT